MLPQFPPFVTDRDRLLEMEDAIETAKSICNSDAQACLFVLLPLEHASTDKINVTKHKRVLEDTLMGSLVRRQHPMPSARRFLHCPLHLGNSSTTRLACPSRIQAMVATSEGDANPVTPS